MSYNDAMSSVAFIIPGFYHSPNETKYQMIAQYFQEKNIKTVVVDIPWKRKVMTDYVNYFKQVYLNNKADENYILGFSYGAVVSFISSPEVKPDLQILCSLSPYFAEDLPNIPQSWKKAIGKRRVKDFKQYSGINISHLVHCETIILFGSEEGSEVRACNDRVSQNLEGKKRKIVLKGVKHDIADARYQQAIQDIIKSL